MQLTVTDRVAWFASLSVTVVNPAKMDEPIQMLFGLWTWVDSRNHALDGGPDRLVRMGNFRGKGHAGRLVTPRGGKHARLLQVLRWHYHPRGQVHSLP